MSKKFEFEVSRLPVVSRESTESTAFLQYENANLAYDYLAPTAGETQARQLLVLVNGFARPRTDFRAFRKRIHAQMPHLATLAFDNRGAGESEGGLDGLNVERMAMDAAFLARTFAHTLGIAGYHCLGISMGGMICQTWAAADPHVLSATFVSTTAGGEARVWPEGVDPAQAVRKPFEEWPRDHDTMLRRMTRYFGPKFRQASPLLIGIMVKNMLKTHTGPSSQGRARAQYDATIAFDGTRSASAIRCPVLVLTGSDDHVIPATNSEALCRLIPQAKMRVFDGIGHLLLIEDPENFVAQVRSFLDALGQ
jgi:3-oxoadipate enol-lactonase